MCSCIYCLTYTASNRLANHPLALSLITELTNQVSDVNMDAHDIVDACDNYIKKNLKTLPKSVATFSTQAINKRNKALTQYKNELQNFVASFDVLCAAKDTPNFAIDLIDYLIERMKTGIDKLEVIYDLINSGTRFKQKEIIDRLASMKATLHDLPKAQTAMIKSIKEQLA